MESSGKSFPPGWQTPLQSVCLYASLTPSGSQCPGSEEGWLITLVGGIRSLPCGSPMAGQRGSWSPASGTRHEGQCCICHRGGWRQRLQGQHRTTLAGQPLPKKEDERNSK